MNTMIVIRLGRIGDVTLTSPAIKNLRFAFPEAEILLRPISLTASAHMGPGTWAVAFLGRLPRPDTHARK